MTRFIRLAVAVLLAQVPTWSPALVHAGGVCILHPQPFKLRSDTIRWSIKIKSGAQCIQGLRWSTFMIDKISIVEAPKSGHLVLDGPSFRYMSDAVGQGSDYFRIAVSGSSLRVDGTSTVEVDVSSQ